MKISSGFFPVSSDSHSCRWRLVVAVALVVFWIGELRKLEGQQDYENNQQLNCENSFPPATYGYRCSGNNAACSSYLTFRSSPPNYDRAATIGDLLNVNPALIAQFNNVSDVKSIPKDTLLTLPVHCSCSRNNNNNNISNYYYQHATSYTLKPSDNYFVLANDTYQGLTTCQALITHNPSHESHNLAAGTNISVPLRCACPSPNQTAATASIRHLLTYTVTWGDTISTIAQLFAVDLQSVLNANRLSTVSTIYPFTTILVPLKTALTPRNALATPPPPPLPPRSPQIPLGPPGGTVNSSNSSGHKWVYVGVGIGAALLFFILSGSLIFFIVLRRRQSADKGKESSSATGGGRGGHKLPMLESVDYSALTAANKSWSISPEGIRYAVESLTLYEFEELEQATNFFSESNRIKGSVYQAYFNGDCAAVKMMKGDVSGEINILKQINHSNIIRLSGFCLHGGNTYLVYEHADNGSLRDWLHPYHQHDGTKLTGSLEPLGWKQRVQIAYDIADAINYLHNYTNPPYIHKNLKSSNVLLDGNLRAKVTNFGLARSLENEDEEAGLVHLTRHVVGTQGYMPPEYIENGAVTPKLDVFAFGVVMLELLSGKEAAPSGPVTATAKKNGGREQEAKELLLLSAAVHEVLGGENVRDKLRDFMDPSLRREYPFDIAFSMAQLAMNCVASDLNARPTIANAFISLSKLLSTSLDWDASDELDDSHSLRHAR